MRYYHPQSSLTITFMKDFTPTLLYLTHIPQFCFENLRESVLQGTPTVQVQIRLFLSPNKKCQLIRFPVTPKSRTVLHYSYGKEKVSNYFMSTRNSHLLFPASHRLIQGSSILRKCLFSLISIKSQKMTISTTNNSTNHFVN